MIKITWSPADVLSFLVQVKLWTNDSLVRLHEIFIKPISRLEMIYKGKYKTRYLVMQFNLLCRFLRKLLDSGEIDRIWQQANFKMSLNVSSTNMTSVPPTEAVQVGHGDAVWILTSAFIIFTMISGFGLVESGQLNQFDIHNFKKMWFF